MERMSRTRVRHARIRRRRLGAALVVLGLAVGLVGPAARNLGSREPRLVALHPYTVRPGDTVWSIAERVAGRGEDPRSLVDAIVVENDLGSGLVPGQILSVPSR
jgi:hypothetical protein